LSRRGLRRLERKIDIALSHVIGVPPEEIPRNVGELEELMARKREEMLREAEKRRKELKELAKTIAVPLAAKTTERVRKEVEG